MLMTGVGVARGVRCGCGTRVRLSVRLSVLDCDSESESLCAGTCEGYADARLCARKSERIAGSRLLFAVNARYGKLRDQSHRRKARGDEDRILNGCRGKSQSIEVD